MRQGKEKTPGYPQANLSHFAKIGALLADEGVELLTQLFNPEDIIRGHIALPFLLPAESLCFGFS